MNMHAKHSNGVVIYLLDPWWVLTFMPQVPHISNLKLWKPQKGRWFHNWDARLIVPLDGRWVYLWEHHVKQPNFSSNRETALLESKWSWQNESDLSLNIKGFLRGKRPSIIVSVSYPNIFYPANIQRPLYLSPRSIPRYCIIHGEASRKKVDSSFV